MIETLFLAKTSTLNTNETAKESPELSSPSQENRVLDPKKSQNIAIALRALNVTTEEVCEALLEDCNCWSTKCWEIKSSKCMEQCVERSEVVARNADVIIMTINAAEGWTLENTKILERNQRNNKNELGSSSPMILVINKIDYAPSDSYEWANTCGFSFIKRIPTCAVSGQGIQDLEAATIESTGLNTIPVGGRRWTVN